MVVEVTERRKEAGEKKFKEATTKKRQAEEEQRWMGVLTIEATKGTANGDGGFGAKE
jgi:hypothetical protein